MAETDAEILDRQRRARKAEQTVKLKNGAEEARVLVPVVMMSLNSLMESGKGIVVYELSEMCKDPDHVPWGNTGDALKELALVDQNPGGGPLRVNNSIRNIVLSAVEGDGLDMTVGDPVDRATDTVDGDAHPHAFED